MCRRNDSYIFIMNNSMTMSPYFCLLNRVFFQTLLTVYFHEGVICWIKQIFSKTIMTKHLVMQHAYFEIDTLNSLPQFEITTVRQCLVVRSVLSACVPVGTSGFHTLSDITWSVVYNAVPEIRLAGSVSLEWFLAIKFQFIVHTSSDGCQ